VRSEPWTPEVEVMEKAVTSLPIKELRRIAEEHEVSLDKLEAIVEELTRLLYEV
jgi:hypothetical protein